MTHLKTTLSLLLLAISTNSFAYSACKASRLLTPGKEYRLKSDGKLPKGLKAGEVVCIVECSKNESILYSLLEKNILPGKENDFLCTVKKLQGEDRYNITFSMLEKI